MIVKVCVNGVDAVNPFVIVALTVAVPAAVVFNVDPVTVAPVVPALTRLHVIVLLVALVGLTVPVNARATPAVAVSDTPVIDVTGTNGAVTVIAKFCVNGVVY